MPTIPTSDIDAMLSTTELADNATIESVIVPGIFDNEYLADLDINGTSPAFTCKTITLDAITPVVARGTTATINTVVYTIENIKDSGVGLTTLILSN